MSTAVLEFNQFELPWASSREEDARFKRILKRMLLLLLLLAFLFPWLPLPEIKREVIERVPATLAKVILQQKLPAPPPPPPAPKERPTPEATAKQKPVSEPPKATKQARKKVASLGVAAFANQLQNLRTSLDVTKLQARNTNVTTGAAARSVRSVLGRESIDKTSGGVSSAAMSTNGSGNGTQLEGRSGVSVATTMGSGGGAGSGGKGGKRGSSITGGRDMEAIRKVFEQHKGAIYAIYNRALRRDPDIQGKYVFRIVIEPDGTISSIKLVSSELGNDLLEQKLLTRIQIINFGADDVAATPVNYKFDFLPG